MGACVNLKKVVGIVLPIFSLPVLPTHVLIELDTDYDKNKTIFATGICIVNIFFLEIGIMV